MWYRIFGLSEPEVPAETILEHLHEHGFTVRGEFRRDERGWGAVQFTFPESAGSPIVMQRYLSDEEGVRNELNTWAAWLETATYNPNHADLMTHAIQTRQLITIRRPIDHADDSRLEAFCLELSQFLARQTNGIFQIDDQGFFAASGELLLEEY